ncbi:TRAM domain-containing protein [Candidatus Micrarchaeota archaeon]|nr:TRAM domain-containing protein [Candidatus Micrarchaeota archaeon]
MAEEPEKQEDAPEDEGSGQEETSQEKVVDLPKPVEMGDELEVAIESVGAKGDGIAKKDGFVIFIPGAQKGETVKIKITELKTSFAIGEKV